MRNEITDGLANKLNMKYFTSNLNPNEFIRSLVVKENIFNITYYDVGSVASFHKIITSEGQGMADVVYFHHNTEYDIWCCSTH